MADKTLEELITSLNNLYVNLNNLDRVYYDIFINPTPMDVTLYRYLDPSINELTTITVPNRAKCAIMTATGILNPNGNQSGEVGSLYINTANYDLYYKGSGSGKIGWYKVYSETNFRPNEQYVTPDGNVATANYAVSASTATNATNATNASVASKLGTSTVGSTNTPIYLNNGEATPCTGIVVPLLEALYPVGSIYIGTQSTCPLATLMEGSDWEQIQGRYLLASGTISGTSESITANGTLAAGLPNITGYFGGSAYGTYNGAFQKNSDIDKNVDGADWAFAAQAYFSASYSNSIYGSSTTVRPAAYGVNVWRRKS